MSTGVPDETVLNDLAVGQITAKGDVSVRLYTDGDQR